MLARKIALAGVSLVMLGPTVAPAQAQCFDWWNRWFGPKVPVVAPYTASYLPTGYGQVVNYMPQTDYRTVYVNAPVTTYCRMAGCDPCTGCPTTVLRPVVSYSMQPRLIPYTTYRPVVVATFAPGAAVTPPTYLVPSAAPNVSPEYASPPPNVGAPLGAPGTTVPSLAPQGFVPSRTQPAAPLNYRPLGGQPPMSQPLNPSLQQPTPAAPEPESRATDPRDDSPSANTSLDSEDQDRSTRVRGADLWLAKSQPRAASGSNRLVEQAWRAAPK